MSPLQICPEWREKHLILLPAGFFGGYSLLRLGRGGEKRRVFGGIRRVSGDGWCVIDDGRWCVGRVVGCVSFSHVDSITFLEGERVNVCARICVNVWIDTRFLMQRRSMGLN